MADHLAELRRIQARLGREIERMERERDSGGHAGMIWDPARAAWVKDPSRRKAVRK